MQWTRYDNPSLYAEDWSAGNSGTPGLFADTVNIDPAIDRTYRMCVKATVAGGAVCYSPIISRLVKRDAPLDPYEVNDTFSDAYFLGGTGSSPSLNDAYIYPAGDSDYFVVSSGSGLLTAAISSLPADYDLFIYDSGYNLVDFSTQYGLVNESIAVLVSSGTYYIVVRGYREAYNEAPYILSVTIP